MPDVTQILKQVDSGDANAARNLFPLVYEELRRLAAARMASELPGQTLQATALVHDAFVRLVDVQQAQKFHSRAHFFAAAAEAMRRILIESARSKKRQKRGGGAQRIDLEAAVSLSDDSNSRSDELLALDTALSEFEQEVPEKAQIVKLRYFAGMTLEEIAENLGISLATVKRHWVYAAVRDAKTERSSLENQ